ncbi:MAG: D-2-hydroxyacid dehydrogenase [Bacillota bacterium]
MKVMLTQDWDKKYSEKIESEFPDIEIVKALEEEEQKQVLEVVDVVLGFPGDLDANMLADAPNLKWVQVLSAGVDKIMQQPGVEKMAAKNILLTNMSGLHKDIIAEHSFALILNFSRRLSEFQRQQEKQEWNRLKLTGLAGKRLLVVGLGAIGREIVTRANAFGMEVIGVKRNPEEEVAGVDKIFSPANLSEAFTDVDYAVTILPLTEETEGLVGREEFAAMPESAYFINVGRGKVVNEAELIKALETKAIAGAGLDVFEEEPLPADSPLYKMNNVIITPHVAGSFGGYYSRAAQMFMENLDLYFKGEKLKRLVDYEAGY